MRNISTDFGVDSSSRFPFRAWTDRQAVTDATEHPTNCSAIPGGIGNHS